MVSFVVTDGVVVVCSNQEGLRWRLAERASVDSPRPVETWARTLARVHELLRPYGWTNAKIDGEPGPGGWRNVE